MKKFYRYDSIGHEIQSAANPSMAPSSSFDPGTILCYVADNHSRPIAGQVDSKPASYIFLFSTYSLKWLFFCSGYNVTPASTGSLRKQFDTNQSHGNDGIIMNKRAVKQTIQAERKFRLCPVIINLLVQH